jgi:DNA-binding response OmpR family regulator
MPGEAFGTRILIIEDDPVEAKDEASQLSRAGFDVRIAFTGRDGLRLIDEYVPDVVLLGVALPDIWGLDLCATIAQTSEAYILLTSGYSAEDLKSAGLELGADDVLLRPFPPEELLARVNAFLRRRARTRSIAAPRLQFGDVVLVRDRQTLEHEGGTSADLTQLEFGLLQFLVDADGRLLTRAQILEHVWNDVSGVATRVVDVHVGSLRKKLGEVGSRLRISSVRGIGYRLDEG